MFIPILTGDVVIQKVGASSKIKPPKYIAVVPIAMLALSAVNAEILCSLVRKQTSHSHSRVCQQKERVSRFGHANTLDFIKAQCRSVKIAVLRLAAALAGNGALYEPRN
jgi:hypothetical protein